MTKLRHGDHEFPLSILQVGLRLDHMALKQHNALFYVSKPLTLGNP